MFQRLFRLLLLLTIVISITYTIQIGCIRLFSLERDMGIIHFSYVFNSVFTFLLLLGIVLVREKFKDQLGFIFMAGSLIKMGLFMAISTLRGFEITKDVFLDFFVSYAICLILEVYYVSRILKQFN